MALIDFDTAKAALIDFRDELKRLKCYRSCDTVERCITRLLDVESVETEAPQTAQRVIRIEKRDRYCRGCGRRFVE